MNRHLQNLHFVEVSLTWSLVLPLSVIYVSVKLTCIDRDVSGGENVYAVKRPSSYWQCTLSCQRDEKCLGMDLCQFANGSSECRLRNTSDIPECLNEAEDGMTCQYIAVVSINHSLFTILYYCVLSIFPKTIIVT
jgi:hypothetical protein